MFSSWLNIKSVCQPRMKWINGSMHSLADRHNQPSVKNKNKNQKGKSFGEKVIQEKRARD